MKTFSFLLFFFFLHSVVGQPLKSTVNNGKILIEASVPDNFKGNTLTLGGFPAPSITMKSAFEFSEDRFVDDTKTVRWELSAGKPLFVYGTFVSSPRNFINFVAEPGDNISISYDKNNKPVFEGEGALKYTLVTEIAVILEQFFYSDSYLNLSTYNAPVSSLQDYLAWNNLLNDQLKTTMAILEPQEGKLSKFAFAAIKESIINQIETKRLEKFRTLCFNQASSLNQSGKNQFGLSNTDLCNIYDSTLNSISARYLMYETPVVSCALYFYIRAASDISREKKQFFREKPFDTPAEGANKAEILVNRYNLTKKKYKGIIRESALAFFFHFSHGVFKSAGFDPGIESILKDYYSTSRFPEYAEAVKEAELKFRERKTGVRDPGFILSGVENESVKKENLTGKVSLFDFWYTGCAGCVQMVPALKIVEKHFSNRKGVQFVNVSIDKDKNTWQKSIKQKKYTTASGISLYTGGKGSDHSLIQNYLISSYPSLILFDAYGKSVAPKAFKDPRTDSAKSLIALIENKLNLMSDGPYIFHREHGTEYIDIFGSEKTRKTVKGQDLIQVNYSTDSSFAFPLKNHINDEPSTYEIPEKMLVLSDIEGNFQALKNLLIAGGVINDKLEWTFGKGHLVFLGDMFDRGDQVTECLWLLYSLEEKAIRAGGYSHYILGNHEIMNLQGDYRYTQMKYKLNASLLNIGLKEMYDPKAELGRWLRSKNIIEKIGDLLFVHGGISKSVNSLELTIDQINRLARPNYSSFTPGQKDKNLHKIMNDRSGIFWYRDYYSANPEKIEATINASLAKFSVNHIITGHTIISDHVNVKFGGKIFNTDTKHAEGKSEALFIEKGNFYGINTTGSRTLLYPLP